jgi:hypothetical protein
MDSYCILRPFASAILTPLRFISPRAHLPLRKNARGDALGSVRARSRGSASTGSHRRDRRCRRRGLFGSRAASAMARLCELPGRSSEGCRRLRGDLARVRRRAVGRAGVASCHGQWRRTRGWTLVTRGRDQHRSSPFRSESRSKPPRGQRRFRRAVTKNVRERSAPQHRSRHRAVALGASDSSQPSGA